MDDLTDWCAGLLSRLEPSARAALAREVAARLRQSQQRRIRANLNPDGSAYEPRKPQFRNRAGSLRRGAMFRKIGSARWLKAQSSADGAIVAFAGQVQRIAQVHQYGQRDTLRNRGRTGPEASYPARELLGFSTEDIESVKDIVLSHLVR